MRPLLLASWLLLLALCTVACGDEGGGAGAAPGGAGADGGPPPSVTVAPVVSTRLPDERQRVGQVRAVEDVQLRARITGFLEQRLFEEGADVDRGQLLFVIEQAPYQAAVARAEAELARARAALKEAELDLRRTRRLERENVASQATLDQAIATEAERQAEVMGAEAELRQARLDLEYTEIHAPISGRIGRSEYSVGDYVGPESGPLASIVMLDPIHVYWQVPEGVILDFRRENVMRAQQGEAPKGVSAHLRFGDGSLYEHTGDWDFLDNRVDPTTGTQTARAVFPNPDYILLPGQYATVIVQVGEPDRTLVIPQSAVQEDQAGRFVLVVDEEGVARLRRVEMGARQGIYWEVLSGLAEDERVIYQGVQKARPGKEVAAKVLPPEAPVSALPPPPREVEAGAPDRVWPGEDADGVAGEDGASGAAEASPEAAPDAPPPGS